MTKTTIKNLTIAAIACMIVTIVVIGAKALSIQFPEYYGQLIFLEIFISFVTALSAVFLIADA